MNTLASINQPYGGLGHQLEKGASVEAWADAAGFNFEIAAYPSLYMAPDGLREHPGRVTLARTDSHEPLSIVSTGYKVVQPIQIMDFYKRLVDSMGFHLNTAGTLHNGRKIWAVADVGEAVNLLGQDNVKGQLLLATSCDGTFATIGKYTTLRIVCNNQLDAMLRDGANAMKILHSQVFDPELLIDELGLADEIFADWSTYVDQMAKYKLSADGAQDFIRNVMMSPGEDNDEVVELTPNAEAVWELYSGRGKGSNLDTAKNTVWGAINAVTEFVDHHRNSHSVDTRMDQAVFGAGKAFKHKAWNQGMDLIAA